MENQEEYKDIYVGIAVKPLILSPKQFLLIQNYQYLYGLDMLIVCVSKYNIPYRMDKNRNVFENKTQKNGQFRNVNTPNNRQYINVKNLTSGQGRNVFRYTEGYCELLHPIL